MALETLKGIKEIDGFKVMEIDEDGRFVGDANTLAKSESPVCVCHRSNTISFKIQDGPIKENGVNGCQVDTIIEAARIIIDGLNKKFPCRENDHVLYHLTQAIDHLSARKRDRENRGVEGTNNG